MNRTSFLRPATALLLGAGVLTLAACGSNHTLATSPVSDTTNSATGQAKSRPDLKALAFAAMKCSPLDVLEEAGGLTNEERKAYAAQRVEIGHRDFSGDAKPETYVTASCFTTTSSNPINVVVFTTPQDGNTPKAVNVLGKEVNFRDLKLSFHGNRVELSGSTVADTDALAEPTHRADLVYEWRGSKLALISKQEVKA